MEKMSDTIFLTDEESGEEVEFEIIDAIEEEGERYILVVPVEEEGEEEALILKDISENSEEAVYRLIEDDEELTRIAAYFVDDNNDYHIDF